MERKTDKRIIELIFLLTSALVLLFVSYNSFLYPVQMEVDTNVFITSARYMSVGKFPYRDFFDHKGPVLYMLFYIFYNLIPNTCHGIYIMEVLFAYIYMHFTYKSIKIISNKSDKTNILITIIGCIFSYSIVAQTHIEVLCLPITAYILYLFIRYIYKDINISKIELIGIGFCLGMIFWMKYFVLILPCLLCFIYFIFCLRDKKYKNIRDLFLYGIIGFNIITAIVLLYGIVTDTLSDIFYVYFYMNLFVYSAQNDIMSFGQKILYVISYTVPITYMILMQIIRKDYKDNDIKKNRVFFMIIIAYIVATVCTMFISVWKYYYINYSSIGSIVIYFMIFPNKPEKNGKHYKSFPKAFIIGFLIIDIAFCIYKAKISNYFYNYEVQREICNIIKDDYTDWDNEQPKIVDINFIDTGFNQMLQLLPNEYYFTLTGMGRDEKIENYLDKIKEHHYDYILLVTREREDKNYKYNSLYMAEKINEYGYVKIYDHDIKAIQIESTNHLFLYKIKE